MKSKQKNEWAKTVRLWKKENEPDFDGYWYCRVGHGALSDGRAEGGLPFNLCHDIARVRDSTKRHRQDNLYAGCPKHNREQGSMSYEEYMSTNPDRHCGI